MHARNVHRDSLASLSILINFRTLRRDTDTSQNRVISGIESTLQLVNITW